MKEEEILVEGETKINSGMVMIEMMVMIGTMMMMMMVMMMMMIQITYTGHKIQSRRPW